MISRGGAATALALIVALSTACQAPAEGIKPSASASASAARAATYLEFRDGFCSAWEALDRAIGNPDAGSDSELTGALNAAIASGDAPAAQGLATTIIGLLEVGRERTRYAGGWPTAASVTSEMDRIFVAFEAATAAKRDAARLGAAEATKRGEAAFTAAGGATAWFATIRALQVEETMRAIAAARPSGVPAMCPNAAVSI